MLKERVITAVILAAVFLSLIVFASPSVFAWAILAVIGVAGWEWVRLSISAPSLVNYAGFILPLLALCYSLTWAPLHFVVTFAAVWLILIVSVFAYPKSERVWNTPVTLYVMGWLVLAMTYFAVVTVRNEFGSGFLISVIVLTAAADIGAYAFGKRWGKHKLAPKVSPGKTWQGYMGGLLCVCLVLFAMAAFAPDTVVIETREWLWLVIFGAVFHMLSVLGDLTESMFKRTRGIKDSSNILPGHGGVLDRVDALLVVIPFVLVCHYAVQLWA